MRIVAGCIDTFLIERRSPQKNIREAETSAPLMRLTDIATGGSLVLCASE
jgi:hypothetical protein